MLVAFMLDEYDKQSECHSGHSNETQKVKGIRFDRTDFFSLN